MGFPCSRGDTVLRCPPKQRSLHRVSCPVATLLPAWPLLAAGGWPQGQGSLQELLLLPNLMQDGHKVRKTGKGDGERLHHGGFPHFREKQLMDTGGMKATRPLAGHRPWLFSSSKIQLQKDPWFHRNCARTKSGSSFISSLSACQIKGLWFEPQKQRGCSAAAVLAKP